MCVAVPAAVAPYQLSASLCIRQEIDRFESVHPSIYAVYDLIEILRDHIVAQQLREHVVCIEGELIRSFIHSQSNDCDVMNVNATTTSTEEGHLYDTSLRRSARRCRGRLGLVWLIDECLPFIYIYNNCTSRRNLEETFGVRHRMQCKASE